MRPAGRQRMLALGGLLLALGGISLPYGTWDNALASQANMVANEFVTWALVTAVLVYVTRIERRPLASIGFTRPSAADLGLATAAGVAIVLMLGVLYLVVFPKLGWDETRQFQPLMAVPFWLRLVTVIRAAVSEEILFRGYALGRTEELTGSRAVAGLFTWGVFTIDHLGYWGWHHLIIAGLAGAVLTLFYLWRGNLWANILAHFIIDAVGFLAG
jgi:membrane protease YdiL (CAAX protease family)